MRSEVLGPMRRMGEGGAGREERGAGRACVSLSLWRGGTGGWWCQQYSEKRRDFNCKALMALVFKADYSAFEPLF